MFELVILWGAFIGFISGIYIAKYCKYDWRKISLIGLVIGIIYSVLVFKTYDSLLEILYMISVSAVLFIGATIDSQLFILPNEGAILLILERNIYSLISTEMTLKTKLYSIIWQLVIAIFWGIVFYAIRYFSKKSLGLGDVKWIVAIAFAIPWEQTYNFVVYAFLLGSFYVFGLYIYRILIKGQWSLKMRGVYIPFGPFLALSALLILWQKVWW